MVERDLAKVEVAGSSPVIRSKRKSKDLCPCFFLSEIPLFQGKKLRKNILKKFKKISKKVLTNRLICDILVIVPKAKAKRNAKGWEHSSAGRASALQAEGHRFEPYCSHHLFGPVAQLVRALACHARGRGFEPHSGRQFCFCRICLCSSVGRAGD